MKDCAKCKNLFTANRILLGLLMLVPGLLKLFVVKPAAVVGMLTGMGYPIPAIMAWVLIIAEITTGVMILGGWNLRYAIIPPAIILTLAGFTAYWGSWPSLILHLAAASNYALLGHASEHKA